MDLRWNTHTSDPITVPCYRTRRPYIRDMYRGINQPFQWCGGRSEIRDPCCRHSSCRDSTSTICAQQTRLEQEIIAVLENCSEMQHSSQQWARRWRRLSTPAEAWRWV